MAARRLRGGSRFGVRRLRWSMGFALASALAATASLAGGRAAVVRAATRSSSADPLIAAVGDIACDPSNSSFNGGLGTSSSCRQKYVADLLVNAAPSAVLILGDNQYYCGGYQAFQQSYDLSWGRLKAVTHPAVGNHEYLTSGGTDCNAQNAGASGYFRYFGAAAGAQGKGYYSFDIGAWHLIALNSNCGDAGGCGPSSQQGIWLRNDLASHPNFCTLAYWHIPLFSSGGRANNNSRTFWDALYASDADLVLVAHDHLYERFAVQRPDGTADSTRGLREFVVGTGGANHTAFTSTIFPNSEVRNDTTYGALLLTLHPTSYDWQFVSEAGKTFTDAGTTQCHGANADRTPPSAPTGLSATPSAPNQVDLAWTASTDDVGVAGYRVSRDGTQIVTVTGTNYRDAAVQPGSTHGYNVVAVDSGGNVSPPSNTATATSPPDLTPPTAPTNLSATVASDLRVNLTWTASSDDVGIVEYQVFRDGVRVGTSTTTAYSDATVAAETTYGYSVVARDSSNNVSSPSNAASVTTPVAPTTLVFTPAEDSYVQADQPTTTFGTSNQVVVDASPIRHAFLKFTVSGVGGRSVLSAKLRLRCVDPSGNGGAFHRVASSAWSETTVNWNNQPPMDSAVLGSLGSVTTGTAYEVDVTSLVTGDGTFTIGGDSTSTDGAYYSSKQGTDSPQLVVTTAAGQSDTNAPTVPTSLRTTSLQANRVDLAWNASTDNVAVTSYKIYRGGSLAGTVSGTTLSFQDTTVAPNTSYSYTFEAFDAANNGSGPSAPLSVTTPLGASDSQPPTAPTNVQATAISHAQVHLTWDASSDNVGVAGYRIYRNGNSTPVGTVGGSTLTFDDTTVAPSTTYTYKVDAVDAVPNPSPKSAASAPVTTPAAPSALTFNPSADSYVDEAAATTNHGPSTQLRIDGSPVNRTYLRFTVEGVVGTVISAKLRIYANSGSSAGHEVRTVADNSWGETTISFSNAPALGPVVGSSGPFSAGAWIEVDVTSLITGNGTYSLALTTPSSTAIGYASREATNKPELVVKLM
jgi:chitodextrinase